MKQHGDMYQLQAAMYPQIIFPHGGPPTLSPMMPNSQMPPNAANMHPQYEYHFQQFPQSPVSAGPPGEYAVHMGEGNQQQMQGGYPSAGGKIQKDYGNRKADNSRPTEEGGGDLFFENSNQNGGGEDYNPHFRAAANSRPPEGMYMYLYLNYTFLLS